MEKLKLRRCLKVGTSTGCENTEVCKKKASNGIQPLFHVHTAYSEANANFLNICFDVTVQYLSRFECMGLETSKPSKSLQYSGCVGSGDDPEISCLNGKHLPWM